ncbi:MAG: hypothetical protein KJO19_07145 [Woeseia sp.]|nr:hypothetical protein [Woeseia sp.]
MDREKIIRFVRSPAIVATLLVTGGLAVTAGNAEGDRVTNQLATAVPVQEPATVAAPPATNRSTTGIAVKEPARATAPPAPTDLRAPFIVQVGEILIPYRVFAIYVDPGETVSIDTLFDETTDTYDLLVNGGESEIVGDNRWRWTAPREPGLYSLVVNDASLRNTVRIHAFVTVPLAELEGAELNGYRIGAYPAKPLRNNPRYLPPAGLVEVTEENRDTLISPNFRLHQFLTKQGGGWPRYVALDERLILKLEQVLAAVRAEGIAAETLFIMSGYRTPFYNKRIGNVQYSRHVYGDAADVFVDVDRDNRMDDLNGDGKSDFKDADYLASIVESLTETDPFAKPLVGGVGRYGSKPHRGPFVHVDTRGYSAQWTSR